MQKAPQKPLQKALIVAPAWIGDAVMAQVLFKSLREKFPDIQLDALASPWVAPVLQHMPEITQIFNNPFAHGELKLGKRLQLAHSLAKNNYQRAYVLPNSLKSALIPFFAGIPKRIGFTGEARYGLINCRHTLDAKALPRMIDRFAQLAAEPGEILPSATLQNLAWPSLEINKNEQAAILQNLGLGLYQRPEKIAIFCPGAEFGSAKRWPTEHFATLAARLIERGFSIYLLGSNKDAALGDEIMRLAKPNIPAHTAAKPALNNLNKLNNFCGSTSLRQAIHLIAAADWVVCNDSGLMHIAAALKRKSAVLYGSSSPDFTPPLAKNAKIMRLQLPCSPCFQRECPLGHLDCLQKLAPQQVLDAEFNASIEAANLRTNA